MGRRGRSGTHEQGGQERSRGGRSGGHGRTVRHRARRFGLVGTRTVATARDRLDVMDSDLAERFDEVRAHTEPLAAPLTAEDQTVQSMPDVSPDQVAPGPRHVVLRDVRAGRARAAASQPFQDQYWFLFNSYYEAVGPRYSRPERGADHPPRRARRGRLPRATSTARMRDLVIDGWTTGRSASCADDRRARLPPRAAAPGADADGHQARAVAQPAASRSTPARRADAARARRRWAGSTSTAGWSRSVTRATGFSLRQRAAAPPAVAGRRTGSPTGW